MNNSPYQNQPVENWNDITDRLIREFPLTEHEILEIATTSWQRLWNTTVGDIFNINEVELPATVVGYFFQKLFAHELNLRYPTQWRGESNKSDKDLVNITQPEFSTEMKSSGQLGYSLFGNRSYNQESENNSLSGKDKSGYYITLNFYQQQMTLLRVGWIDQNDWIPQGAQTGQAAVLKPEIYQYKLRPIVGDYIKYSPIQLLSGIGNKTLLHFHANNIYTFDELKNYTGDDKKILQIKQRNTRQLSFPF